MQITKGLPQVLAALALLGLIGVSLAYVSRHSVAAPDAVVTTNK